MSIEARNITKRFGSFTALDDVSIEVKSGELTALLGPSGSGKTTLLRIIAGLEFADSGRVLFHGEDASDQPVRERKIGFVFQHYALFRHMTVFENVAFGLRVKPRRERPSKAEIEDRVMKMLKLVQVDWLARQYPAQLSGGQRQRVALARVLVTEPKVLLLDEPFGALDAQVRKELRRWLRRLHDEIHVTSVFVTHDQEEALELSDKVVVMNKGKIEQAGNPEDVFHRPATEFVMNFLGNVNLFHGRMEEGRAVIENGTANDGARIFVRPHEFEISHVPFGSDEELRAKVERVFSGGPQAKIDLSGDGGKPIYVEIPYERLRVLQLKAGQSVYLRPRDVRVFIEDYQI